VSRMTEGRLGPRPAVTAAASLPAAEPSVAPSAVTLPADPAACPGVVLGAEAYGVNPFILGVRDRLVELGYAATVPDYYRGRGPEKVDSYDDFTEVVEHIGRLDFSRGARDLAGAVDALRARPEVDAGRVAVWGYCTGGTLAWLAAALRGDIAAAVLFFPSQPRFHELGPHTPVHPIDLLWQLTCPTLFLYGDADPVMPPELLDDLRARIDGWGVDAEVRSYPGAGHSFTAPWGPMRHADADRAAWADAVAFLAAHTARPTDADPEG
jgi:carboxymethylenebutenolidase